MGPEMMRHYFRPLSSAKAAALIAHRPGEVKLGERVLLPGDDWMQELQHSTARFVVFGIPEDIGVRANLGIGGTHTAWDDFLVRFLNVQSGRRLYGTEVLLLGAFDFSEWMETLPPDADALRKAVVSVDLAVTPLVQAIVSAGKIPVVIGGGHNNCYPLLRGCAGALGHPLNAINLDPHADYRHIEGRHSGNGFRYARVEGFLHRYAAIGLHEHYNEMSILQEFLDDPDLHASFYDAIVCGEQDFEGLITTGILHVRGAKTGVELDLDAIAGVLASAGTPSGISAFEARRYVYRAARELEVAYLHLPEGAVLLRNGQAQAGVGKLLAYLVSDFMKGVLDRR